MCNGGASKLKSAEASRLSTVRSAGASASTATRTWDNQRRPYPALPVPVGNLRPEILVVQSAQNWHRQRATDGMDSTRDRRVLQKRTVSPRLVVIFLVRIEQMADMSFAEDNNIFKTIPSYRTDEPLRISILPW